MYPGRYTDTQSVTTNNEHDMAAIFNEAIHDPFISLIAGELFYVA